MIDLHSHTTASDGQYPPTELVAKAAAAGVRHLAVTDHDTVAGLEEATRAAAAHGLELVPGIELSAFLHGREVHVLGHFVDRQNEKLARFSDLLRTERHQRMEQMVQKAQGLGFPITMADVLRIAGDAQLGRPHLARVFVEKGWCLDVREAFDRFLGNGKPAWVDRYKLEAHEAISLIHHASGAATVAHPGVSKVERFELEQLRDQGLDGLEVYHSDQPAQIQEKYLTIARELGLIATAGSDFHGEKVTGERRLGTAAMDAAEFERLRRTAVARA